MPAASHAFETIAAAKVGRSAAEARDLGFLKPGDEIVMNRERLLAAAKAKALALVKDYKPPAPAEFHLPGPSGKTALMLAADVFVHQGKATAHDRVVAEALANVLTGGPEADQTIATTEDRITRLERAGDHGPDAPAQDLGPHGAHARHRQAAAELRTMQFLPHSGHDRSIFPRPLDGSSRRADRWLGWGRSRDDILPGMTPLPNPPPQGGRERHSWTLPVTREDG